MSAPQASLAPLRVSTDTMPTRERLAMWREAFGRAVLHVDIEPRTDVPFKADATIRAMPGLGAAFCVCTAARWRRTGPMIAETDDSFGMAFNLGRTAVLSQRGRVVELGVGDAVTISHFEPATLDYSNHPSPHIGLVISLKALAPLVGDVEAAAARRIPKESEALRLLTHYLGILRDDLALATPELRQVVVTQIHDLIALAIGATGDGAAIAIGRGVRAARLRAVKADVVANLVSHDLSVAAVALRQRVTPRYVHMLFEAEGTTFSQFVLAERLGRVYRRLTQPYADHLTITAIAYEAGFGDLSHFNHAFRRRYGTSPSEVRRTT